MTQKEQILAEWLLRNNFIWDNINNASKIPDNYIYSGKVDNISESNSEEIKTMLSKRGNWYTVCPALFAGDLVYFENESFISSEDIADSRKNLCEWILKNKIRITNDGISVVHNKNFCKTYKSANNIDSEQVPMIHGWYSGKDVIDPRTKMKRISSFIKNSAIIIRNTALFGDNGIANLADLVQNCLVTMGESSEVLKKFTSGNEDKKENDFGKLLYKNSLACKFNEVDDFIYVGEIWMEKHSILTLNNFPNLVRGNLVIEKCYFLNDYSGFPKRVKGSVYFNDCRYKEFIEFPSGVSIDGNFNFDGQNTQHMLLALAKSDVKIGGNICCPLYSGTVEYLREIAKEGKWFEEYEKVKQERSVR